MKFVKFILNFKIEILKGYQGDLDKLGEAEKFMHALIQVPK